MYPSRAPAIVSPGLWSGLGDADVFDRGAFLDPGGMFDVEIQRCLSKRTQKSGDCFIVEFDVLASSLPAHPAGSRRTWIQKMQNVATAHGAVKGFLMAIFNLEKEAARKHDFDPYLERFMRQVEGPRNILAGKLVHLETVHITTKEKGNDFTRHDWSPFDFAGMNVPPPSWQEHLQLMNKEEMQPSIGYGPPANSGAVGIPPGSQLTPDRQYYLPPGATAWIPVPILQAAPAPPPASMPPYLVPGTQYSPDGAYYLPPGARAWIPMPAGVRRTG
jgi:hypothetical protein